MTSSGTGTTPVPSPEAPAAAGPVPEPNPDVRLRPAQRILETTGYAAVFQAGHSFAGRRMVLWYRRTDRPLTRLGVVTSRRTFRRSVDRSRARRLLREAFRLNRWRLVDGCDVVLIGRWQILQAARQDVEKDLLKLARQAGLCRAEGTACGSSAVV